MRNYLFYVLFLCLCAMGTNSCSTDATETDESQTIETRGVPEVVALMNEWIEIGGYNPEKYPTTDNQDVLHRIAFAAAMGSWLPEFFDHDGEVFYPLAHSLIVGLDHLAFVSTRAAMSMEEMIAESASNSLMSGVGMEIDNFYNHMVNFTTVMNGLDALGLLYHGVPESTLFSVMESMIPILWVPTSQPIPQGTIGDAISQQRHLINDALNTPNRFVAPDKPMQYSFSFAEGFEWFINEMPAFEKDFTMMKMWLPAIMGVKSHYERTQILSHLYDMVILNMDYLEYELRNEWRIEGFIRAMDSAIAAANFWDQDKFFKDGGTVSPADPTYLQYDRDFLNFAWSGGTGEIMITSNTEWTITVDNDPGYEIYVDATSGNGNAVFTVTAPSNMDLAQKVCTVMIDWVKVEADGSQSGRTELIPVYVDGVPRVEEYLTIDVGDMCFTHEGGIFIMNITSNASWEISNYVDPNLPPTSRMIECSYNKTRGTGSASVNVSVPRNPSSRSTYTCDILIKWNKTDQNGIVRPQSTSIRVLLLGSQDLTISPEISPAFYSSGGNGSFRVYAPNEIRWEYTKAGLVNLTDYNHTNNYGDATVNYNVSPYTYPYVPPGMSPVWVSTEVDVKFYFGDAYLGNAKHSVDRRWKD